MKHQRNFIVLTIIHLKAEVCDATKVQLLLSWPGSLFFSVY